MPGTELGGGERDFPSFLALWSWDGINLSCCFVSYGACCVSYGACPQVDASVHTQDSFECPVSEPPFYVRELTCTINLDGWQKLPQN